MWQKFIIWLENNQSTCNYKKHFGVRCPGCGMQTSILELMRGNIWESILIYPALIPIIITVIFSLIQVIFKLEKGAKILFALLIFDILLVLINFLIKL